MSKWYSIDLLASVSVMVEVEDDQDASVAISHAMFEGDFSNGIIDVEECIEVTPERIDMYKGIADQVEPL